MGGFPGTSVGMATLTPGGGVEKGTAFLQKPFTRVAPAQKVRETLDSAAKSAGSRDRSSFRGGALERTTVEPAFAGRGSANFTLQVQPLLSAPVDFR